MLLELIPRGRESDTMDSRYSMNWHLYIIFVVILSFFSLANLSADKIPFDQSLLTLKEEMDQMKRGRISKSFQRKIRKSALYSTSDSNCNLILASKISSVTYYRLSCQESEEPNFIEFSSRKKNLLRQGEFRLKAVHRIGKKQYLEIQTGQIVLDSDSIANWKQNTDDTELDFPQKKEQPLGIKPQSNDTRTNQTRYQPIQNPNLYYFQSIAENPKRRKEVPSNLDVFFDTSCPLEFLEKDQSFYWDQTISYVFRITCVKDSIYRLIRVPSTPSGELLVSNTIWKDPKPGERVLGKAFLKKISETQIVWEKVILYYE